VPPVDTTTDSDVRIYTDDDDEIERATRDLTVGDEVYVRTETGIERNRVVERIERVGVASNGPRKVRVLVGSESEPHVYLRPDAHRVSDGGVIASVADGDADTYFDDRGQVTELRVYGEVSAFFRDDEADG